MAVSPHVLTAEKVLQNGINYLLLHPCTELLPSLLPLPRKRSGSFCPTVLMEHHLPDGTLRP